MTTIDIETYCALTLAVILTASFIATGCFALCEYLSERKKNAR